MWISCLNIRKFSEGLLFKFAVFIWFFIFLRKKLTFKFGLSPNTFEIKSIKGLKKLSDNLKQSLSKNFMENVEERGMKRIS